MDRDVIEAWATMMNELCADSKPEDEQLMMRAIDEQRREAKDQVRRAMGLSEQVRQ